MTYLQRFEHHLKAFGDIEGIVNCLKYDNDAPLWCIIHEAKALLRQCDVWDDEQWIKGYPVEEGYWLVRWKIEPTPTVIQIVSECRVLFVGTEADADIAYLASSAIEYKKLP